MTPGRTILATVGTVVALVVVVVAALAALVSLVLGWYVRVGLVLAVVAALGGGALVAGRDDAQPARAYE